MYAHTLSSTFRSQGSTKRLIRLDGLRFRRDCATKPLLCKCGPPPNAALTAAERPTLGAVCARAGQAGAGVWAGGEAAWPRGGTARLAWHVTVS